MISGQPQSTEFALTRFWVPLLAHSGWCLFVDCDVVFMRDPRMLIEIADESKAVQVVKHPSLTDSGTKMDGQTQVPYERKNWSSVTLWNCSHPANRRITLDMLNGWHRRDLHGFKWLHDDEIGDLPRSWNWLVGVTKKPDQPAIAHYTKGGPWLEGWPDTEHDDIWNKASQR